MTFGELLKQHMDINGLNQSDVSRITGFTRAAICQIIGNKRSVMLNTAIIIVRKLQMPINTWLEIEPAATEKE